MQIEEFHPDGLVCHTSGVLAALSVIGGVDKRIRLGGQVFLEDESVLGVKNIKEKYISVKLSYF